MNSGSSETIKKEIKACVIHTEDPAGRSVNVIYETDALKIAGMFDRTLNDIYLRSLEAQIWPQRYIRNQDTLTLHEQYTLAKSKVAVIGCGGLGGHVLMMLSRIGIGALVIADPDTFDESNLNRQAFADTHTLGMLKTLAAEYSIGLINPAVTVKAFQAAFNQSNASLILGDCDVVVDALDNLPDRKILILAACQKKIPIVHGAVAGFEGQVVSILYGEESVYDNLFGSISDRDISRKMNAESIMGVPSITPVFIASLQAMEVVKILLKKGNRFSRRMLFSDIEAGEFNYFDF
jgi:molybdopterin/thiamine biosynthesis adenylyltransferase